MNDSVLNEMLNEVASALGHLRGVLERYPCKLGNTKDHDSVDRALTSLLRVERHLIKLKAGEEESE